MTSSGKEPEAAPGREAVPKATAGPEAAPQADADGKPGGFRGKLSGLAGAALMITAVTLASRLVGFARTMVMAHTVGTEGPGSAYVSANVLPNILFEVAAGGALAGAIVPLLAGPIARRAQGETSKIASAMLGWTLLVLVPLGGVLAVAAHPIAAVFVGPGLVDTMAAFVRVFALQVPLYGFAVVLSSILQAHKRFFWQAFAPLLSSLTVIVVFLVYSGLADGHEADVNALPTRALTWLAWGTTAGVAMLAIPLIGPVRSAGVRLRPTLRFPGGEGSRARALAFAGVGAVIAQQVSMLVTLKAAHTYGTGATFPTFTFAQQVYLLPYAILAFPLATSTFPRLAEHIARGRRPEFAALTALSTRAIIVVAAAGAAALIAAAPAVEVVFDWTTPTSVAGMGAAIATMAPGIIGFALILHVSRALYTLDQGRRAVVATAIGWSVVAVLCIALPAASGAGTERDVLMCLGAASAAGMTVAGILLVLAIRRAGGPAAAVGIARTVLVALVGAGVGAGLGAALSRAFLPDAVAGALGVGLACAVVAMSVTVGAVLLADRSVLAVVRR